MADKIKNNQISTINTSGAAFTIIADDSEKQRLGFNASCISTKLLEYENGNYVLIEGKGDVNDNALDNFIRKSFFDGLLLNWEIVIPNCGTITGRFQITSLEYTSQDCHGYSFDFTLTSFDEFSFFDDESIKEQIA